MALKSDPLIPGLQERSRGDLVQQRLCERHQLPQAVGHQLGLLGLGFGDTCGAGLDAQATTTGRQGEGEREREGSCPVDPFETLPNRAMGPVLKINVH
jgi:hypothetical protein